MRQNQKRLLVKDHARGRSDSGFSVKVRENLIYRFSHLHSVSSSSWLVLKLFLHTYNERNKGIFFFCKIRKHVKQVKDPCNIFNSVKADMKMLVSLHNLLEDMNQTRQINKLLYFFFKIHFYLSTKPGLNKKLRQIQLRIWDKGYSVCEY